MNLSGTQFTHCRRGFTLIELMISLALMVLLMLGVNFIFTAVGGATSSAQVLSKIGRDIQAAQNVMASDFSQIAMKDGPCFLINSQVQPAFENQKDQLGAKDSSQPLIDDDGNPISVASYNYRNHRTDIVSFFSRGNFHRMTGNDGEFVNDMSSTEAWLWYGHLRLANNDATAWPRMGEGDKTSNPNNFFSSQWALGRVAMLLVEPDENGKILDPNGKAQDYIDRGVNLTPLSQGATMEAPGTTKINKARYDLAGTSINGFSEIMKSYVLGPPPGPADWYSRMMLNDNDTIAFGNTERRFQASTFIKKPIDAAAASTQVPIFLSGCASFGVEFAGDFFTQDPATGAVKQMVSDGEMDYVIIPNVQFPANSVRQIRWYGMPRDTSSAIDTSARTNGQPDGIIKGDGPSENMYDVVPLQDVMAKASPVIPVPAKFVERKVPTHFDNYAQTTDAPKDFQYIAAWGPDVTTPKPSLIRLVITQDDPNGRLKNGLTFEYVYKVQ